jgi:multicomponent Na+:H+ antiporter subunit D
MTTASGGAWLTAPVAGPLLAAALLVLLRDHLALRRGIALGTAAGLLVVASALLVRTADGTVLTQRLGGWAPGIAITLAGDALATLMVTVTAVLALACLAFAAATGADADRAFLPQSLLLIGGVNGAYLTSDLFNLFVFIEVMLVPSYVLIALGGGAQRLAAARLYLTVNLLASTVFLAGVGLVYGTTGTVALGDLAGTAATDPAVAVAGAVVLLAMSVKAAVVPLHGWLPRAYSVAPAAVTALFSGLLTKVGVYAMIRFYAVVYAGDPRYLWMILAAALVTMVVGVLGAIGAGGMRTILTFHMVSQIGYIVLGLALFTEAGLAAAVYFLVQYVLVKAALLQCAGAVEHAYGSGELDRLGGLAFRHTLLATAFAVSALSLAGVPPLSGFVGKLGLVAASIDAGRYLAAGLAVAVSLFTLLSMLKIWNGAFWSTPPPQQEDGAVATRVRTAAPALVLAALSLGLGVGAEPLLAVAEVAAQGLVDTSDYVEAVSRP